MGQARRRVPGDATKKCSLRNSPKKVVTVIVATVDGDDGRREQQEDEEQKHCCGAAHGCCHRCCCYSSSKWIDNNSQTQFLAHISLSVPLSNLPQISRSLSLSQMSLESLFIFSFRVCCWRKAFQDFVRKLPRFGSPFFWLLGSH